MNLISLENISKNYSEKTLLNNISLGINEGEKIGLIGVNGTGTVSYTHLFSIFDSPTPIILITLDFIIFLLSFNKYGFI